MSDDFARPVHRPVSAILYAANRFTADILMSWLGAAGAQWGVEAVALPDADVPPGPAVRRHDLVILGSLLEDRDESALLALMRRLGARHPAAPVVVISDQFDAARVRTCLAEGARGFIPATTPPQVAMAALTLVVTGGTYVPALVLEGEAVAGASASARPSGQGDARQQPAAPHAAISGNGSPPTPTSTSTSTPGNGSGPGNSPGNSPGNGGLVPLESGDPGWQRLGLTPREKDVLALLSRGHSNRQIARALTISENTAMVHVRNLMRKLGATNRTQAVFNARRALNHPDGLE
ncbi:LuxR C-terminal-related transcriptional regulator [Novispirillum sp. DQ9]|uniref:response regulator transcription factor n=1 Tax=Novispirillum sp. DQ9 TaxID=3398612 RepID=UPI003C7A5ED9